MGESTKRINLSLSQEKYDLLKELAEEHDTSMAKLVEEFMDVGMELLEDMALAEIMEERMDEEPDRLLTIDDL
jgi:predicted DNA-binding protein